MTGTETKLDRRELWTAIATTSLPLPVYLVIYGRPDGTELGGVRQWASIRLDDNSPHLVDEWAVAHTALPAYGSVVKSKGAKPFRAYEANIMVAGWPVEVCSYVDTDVVKP